MKKKKKKEPKKKKSKGEKMHETWKVGWHSRVVKNLGN